MLRMIAGTIALAALLAPAAHAASCRGTQKVTNEKPKLDACVLAKQDLIARDGPSASEGVLCTLKKNEKFWAQRGAGTTDGLRWYKIWPAGKDFEDPGYVSEFSTAKGKRVLTIKSATGCGKSG